jgi:hypothetical protein
MPEGTPNIYHGCRFILLFFDKIIKKKDLIAVTLSNLLNVQLNAVPLILLCLQRNSVLLHNYANIRNNIYKPPDSIIVAGNVKTQAKAILAMVLFCRFFTPFEATIAPATPDDSTWVVDTGKPN